MSDDYSAFCESVRALCAVDLHSYKRAQMERRIRSFARQRGAATLDRYACLLAEGDDELDAFLDRITINVSGLWRHPEQWARLARAVLPELAGRGGSVRAWSAGCSNGAEAYTLAAVSRDAVPDARVEILGSDIDRRMIALAREATYSDHDARDAPAGALTRWFARVPGGWRADARLRARTRFEICDLLRRPVERADFDLVMCRNMVIYFTEPVRDELHARLVDSLAPGGYLVVGPTERVSSPRALGLELVHPFMYRRR